MTSRPRPHASELPPASLEGWYVLHQSIELDWTGLQRTDPGEAGEALRRFAALAERWSAGAERGWSGVYRVAGSGIDFLILHFRDTFDRLIEADGEMKLSAWGDHVLVREEYLSVVELGLYSLTRELSGRTDPEDREAWDAAVADALAEERRKGYVRRRLAPRQPEHMPYVCTYPMNKRRNPGQNWYTLSLEERAELMAAHGRLGRRFAGRIVQVISGSMGLDDWEWAVTLWAADPLEFKAIISEMRYDGASAEYADFGPFVVGKRMVGEEIEGLLPSVPAR
ncbi:MAG: heme-dependent peroxidase [Gemmatimonadales bacterium]|nr:heme-dependent peroxidase [Gemmatimonadales bacterium]MYG49336.1 heme-dependent peroxidase [Gemmatimonadales bacterium]MYK02950.1 heme-dependent peroxidase [Candidatus Palauibacter ramosifaciens]